jgi:hypothetical protein
MIKLTIQKAPDGVWIVDIIARQEGAEPDIEQSHQFDSYDQAVWALPKLLQQPTLHPDARTS